MTSVKLTRASPTLIRGTLLSNDMLQGNPLRLNVADVPCVHILSVIGLILLFINKWLTPDDDYSLWSRRWVWFTQSERSLNHPLCRDRPLWFHGWNSQTSTLSKGDHFKDKVDELGMCSALGNKNLNSGYKQVRSWSSMNRSADGGYTCWCNCSRMPAAGPAQCLCLLHHPSPVVSASQLQDSCLLTSYHAQAGKRTNSLIFMRFCRVFFSPWKASQGIYGNFIG